MGKVALYFSGKGGVDILKNMRWDPKRIAVAVCVIVVIVLALGLGVGIHKSYRLPEGYVEITGAIVDNRYNNFISESDLVNDTGDLVRIGDNIYYNYYGTYATYGLYEISSNRAQRIHWDGYGPWAFLIGHDIKLYPIQEYSGKLLMNTIIVDGNYYLYNREIKDWELAQGKIQTFNEETRSFDETVLFGGISDIHTLTYQETSFGFVYESADRFDLWVYTEESGAEKIAATDVYSFYTVGEQIYYLTLSTGKDQYVLRVYDWEEKTDTVVCEWADYSHMRYIIVEENNLVFIADNNIQNTQSVYKLNLSNPEQKEKVIYSIDRNDPDSAYIYSWNVWNGTVYLCTDKGLIACDLDTGAHRVLCDTKTIECDIVDDTWVYFIEPDSHYLWRVPQSGGKVELVLG